MLSSHRDSSLSWLALLSCVNFVVAGPLPSSPLYRRNQDVLIGYRYVSETKANEYNKFGRLTSVGASRTQLGEGAYIAPTLDELIIPDDYRQCAIFADEHKFRTVMKMYIPDHSNTFYSTARLSSYLTHARLNHASTILFSKVQGDPNHHIQMMIPPYYLSRSPEFHGPYGQGDLGISVKCVPKKEQNWNYYGDANWGGVWNIPGYAADVSETCAVPSPAGPIQIPSSMLPSPSADISTVSSYSFTQSVITTSSSALPSGVSYLPSGSSSAVPPPVSGVSSGSIIFVSSSAAFSFPPPVPSSVTSYVTPPASVTAVPPASGASSAVSSPSVGAFSVQTSGAVTSAVVAPSSSSVVSSPAAGTSDAVPTSAAATSSVVPGNESAVTSSPAASSDAVQATSSVVPGNSGAATSSATSATANASAPAVSNAVTSSAAGPSSVPTYTRASSSVPAYSSAMGSSPGGTYSVPSAHSTAVVSSPAESSTKAIKTTSAYESAKPKASHYSEKGSRRFRFTR